MYIEKELGNLQKLKVEILVDKVLSLNIFETRYFALMIKEMVQKTCGINPMKINPDWPAFSNQSTRLR